MGIWQIWQYIVKSREAGIEPIYTYPLILKAGCKSRAVGMQTKGLAYFHNIVASPTDGARLPHG
jgi:hypothetical protein